MCAEAERTVIKYGERVDKQHVDKVMKAVELVKEALAADSADLKQLVAGLDVSLLDLGRVIHSGNRQSQPRREEKIAGASNGKKKQNYQDELPIELGEVAKSKSESKEDDGVTKTPTIPLEIGENLD